MAKLSRRKLLAAAAPLAATPALVKLAAGDAQASGRHDHSSHDHSRHLATHEGHMHGHAAMVGAEAVSYTNLTLPTKA